MSAPVRPSVRPVVLLLRGYQRWISPGLPPHCRFRPSCSAYAVEALQVHGLLQGSALTVWRLLRCAPWHAYGDDPVPLDRWRFPRWSRTPRTRPARTGSAEQHEEQAPC